MSEGRYLYCMLEGGEEQSLGKVGIGDRDVYTIGYRALSAVVSPIPFKEVEPDMTDIAAHQRAVEAARKVGTVLPVRFGVIFKDEGGVKKLLKASYKDFKSKIARFKGKDEYGVKIVLEKASVEKIERLVEEGSEEAKKIREEVASAGPGEAYFLKMRLEEAVKNEVLKKIDQTAGEIHQELAKTSEDSRLLKAELEQIILNAAYLIDRNKSGSFHSKLEALKKQHEGMGLMFHVSGPWAPYSFCQG